MRQAISVVLLVIGAVIGTTLGLLALTDLDTDVDAVRGHVGLRDRRADDGHHGDLPALGQLLLVLLMLTGRVGPVTMVTALALRERPRLYRYPEERPIVG